MILDPWPRCYHFLWEREGGFLSAAEAKRIGDRGGATFSGIALATVVRLDADGDGRLDFDLDHDGDVDEADIALLKDHPEKIESFYRERYWIPSRAPELPWPWPLYLLDGAVNHGVQAAVFMAQKAVGAKADGIIGPATLRAIAAAGVYQQQGYLIERSSLYLRLTLREMVETATREGQLLYGALQEYRKGTRKPLLYAGWQRRLFELQAEAGRP